jgi:hypothetical protein
MYVRMEWILGPGLMVGPDKMLGPEVGVVMDVALG